MLAAANGDGYTAYTRPGQYDVHDILPTEGGGEELTPSVYEQFIARVVASANAAAEAAKRAASGEENAQAERQRGGSLGPADRRQRHAGRRLCRTGRGRCRACGLLRAR